MHRNIRAKRGRQIMTAAPRTKTLAPNLTAVGIAYSENRFGYIRQLWRAASGVSDFGRFPLIVHRVQRRARISR